MRRIVVWALRFLLVAAGAGRITSSSANRRRWPRRPGSRTPATACPPPAEFEELARTDPVKMLEACLTRYQREVKSGITATLIKRERVNGEPKPPKEPREEVVQLSVRGDVRGGGGKRRPNVRMVWVGGAKSLMGTVERDAVRRGAGRQQGQDLSRRLAQFTRITCRSEWLDWRRVRRGTASRTPGFTARCCARTPSGRSGRTTEHFIGDLSEAAWLREVGGRECFVVERTCPSPEVDPFEIGGEPNLGGKKPEDVGSVRVRLFIDAERWLQVGSELHRAGRQFARLVLLPRHQPESHLRGRHLHRSTGSRRPSRR